SHITMSLARGCDGMLLRFLTLFSFNATAPTDIYTLSLHDALPISQTDAQAEGRTGQRSGVKELRPCVRMRCLFSRALPAGQTSRSEEHTSELQSRSDLVCRLLLEKKKRTRDKRTRATTRDRGQNPL